MAQGRKDQILEQDSGGFAGTLRPRPQPGDDRRAGLPYPPR